MLVTFKRGIVVWFLAENFAGVKESEEEIEVFWMILWQLNSTLVRFLPSLVESRLEEVGVTAQELFVDEILF